MSDYISQTITVSSCQSGCGEWGDKGHGEEGVVSAWDCVGCKIFPTSTFSSHFCKTQRDSFLSLNLRATHSSPSKHHMHPSQETRHKKTSRWHCPQVKGGRYTCMECHRLLPRSTSHFTIRITSGTQVGKVATSPLPPGGSPPLQSGGHNHKWPTNGQGGYITLAAWAVSTASERGAESQVAHKWATWLHNPCRLGGPHRFIAGAESEVAHKWARWLHHPCRMGGLHSFRAGGRIRRGPQMGKVAT